MAEAKSGLQRSVENRMLGGVCGGIAEWLGWEPLLVRILFVVVSIASAAFPGLIVYLLLWILMPERLEEADGREPRLR